MTEFIEKVQKMRRLQKAYFRGERDSMTLRACKQAEQDVDRSLSALTNQGQAEVTEVEHPKLF